MRERCVLFPVIVHRLVRINTPQLFKKISWEPETCIIAIPPTKINNFKPQRTWNIDAKKLTKIKKKKKHTK